MKESIWSRSHPVKVASVQCHWAEGDWTMQQQEKKRSVGVSCDGVLWSLSSFYGITYGTSHEWVSAWVSEWVSIFFFFLWRMKRRVYVISVSLYIFCRRNNGQVPTHTLKGKLRRQIRLWRVSWALGQCSYTRQPSSFPSFTDTTVPFGISQWKVDKTQTHAV